MAKVTSKLQVTVPKAIADQFGIRAGDEIEWIAAGEGIRVVPAGKEGGQRTRGVEGRLELFDQATQRQRKRDRTHLGRELKSSGDRGWTREDLYQRGFPR